MSKNKKNVIRITICIFAFLAVFITGKFVDMNLYASLAIYGAIYVASGYDVLFKAARNIAHGKVFDENFLMTIASLGAFALGIAEGTGDFAESVAVILFYQVGELFQSYAVGKSRQSIASLMDIRPDKARVERNGEKVEVYPEEVTVGESVFVVAGEKIPLDGVVVGGHGNLNTCALTGESAPAFVQAGDEVLSGTIALDGNLEIRVTKEFYDSTASKILDMVENASGKKAKTENFISAFAKYYTPFVVFSAVALAVIPSLVIGFSNGFTGALWGEWIKRALTFLVVSCPCALVISIPLGFFGGIGGASSKGILVKGANYIEQLNKTNVIFFDKTGTLTTGEFSVTGVYPEEKKDEILRYASVCESHSTHPIAVGITKAYAAAGGTIPEGYEIEEIAGKAGMPKGYMAFMDTDLKTLTQLHPQLYHAVEEVGLDYFISSALPGRNRILYQGKSMVAFNLTPRNVCAGSPYVRMSVMEDIVECERTAPGWIMGVLDSPVVSFTPYIWNRGSKFMEVVNWMVQGETINVLPHTISRYIRILKKMGYIE